MRFLAKKKAVVLVLYATNDPSSDELASQTSTAAYYELNAAGYVSRTINADISELYQPFLSMLPVSSRSSPPMWQPEPAFSMSAVALAGI